MSDYDPDDPNTSYGETIAWLNKRISELEKKINEIDDCDHGALQHFEKLIRTSQNDIAELRNHQKNTDILIRNYEQAHNFQLAELRKGLKEEKQWTIKNREDLLKKLDSKSPTEGKKDCPHKETSPSSDPSIWYICHDCGAHLNQRFEEIPYRSYDDIFKKDSGGEMTYEEGAQYERDHPDEFDENPILGNGIPVDARYPATDSKPSEPINCSKCNFYTGHTDVCVKCVNDGYSYYEPRENDYWNKKSKELSKEYLLISEFVEKIDDALCRVASNRVFDYLRDLKEEYEEKLK